MSELVKSHIPVGTPDELRALGLSTGAIGSCAPSDGNKMRGCPYYAQCIFGRKEYGGFRDKGPKYIGYYLRTTEGAKKEDLVTCFGFMGTLYDRMRAQDDTDEMIAVVAQEGDEITVKSVLPGPPPQPGGTGKLLIETRAIKVPAFPRPNESSAQDDYESKLTERRRELQHMQRMEREGLAVDEPRRLSAGDVATGETDWGTAEQLAPTTPVVAQKGKK